MGNDTNDDTRIGNRNRREGLEGIVGDRIGIGEGWMSENREEGRVVDTDTESR